jgi:hypothetical protein
MNPETKIQRLLMMAMSDAGATVFRNETGRFWTGRVVHQDSGQVTLQGAIMVPCGLCVGSSDVVGFTPVTITANMVGQTLAVFTAVEVKTRTGRATKEQVNFISQVQKAGGFAGIARNYEEALTIIKK